MTASTLYLQAVFEKGCDLDHSSLRRDQSGQNGGGGGGGGPGTDPRAHLSPVRAGLRDGTESRMYSAEGVGLHEGAPRTQGVLRTGKVGEGGWGAGGRGIPELLAAKLKPNQSPAARTRIDQLRVL